MHTKRPIERIIPREREEDIKEQEPKTRIERVVQAVKEGANTRSQIYKKIPIDEGTARQVITQAINAGLIKSRKCECNLCDILEVN